jgi:methionyl-tRNA formyltransferase
MRILFAGSPEIALPSLELLAKKGAVCGVLTAPDRPSGRGRKLNSPPVKELADELGIPVLQPVKLNREAREAVGNLKPDLMAVFAYSKIFGPKFLSLFPKGAVNVHPSLLPKCRGPAPIPAAILCGETETGVTVQYVGLKMDAGDILLQRGVAIDERETAGELACRIAPLGAELLDQAITMIENGTANPVPQDEERATYCNMLCKTDGRIDWDSTADEISRQIRAFNPWPMAYTTFNGSKLSILMARAVDNPADDFASAPPGKVVGIDKAIGILIKTKHGILSVEELQLQSRKALGWKAFLNGTPGFTDTVLGGE